MRTVVKVGGARAVDPAGALGDVARLVADEADGHREANNDAAMPNDSATDDHEVVLTHGGSTAVDETLERLGIEPEYVETPSGVVGRFTDSETMEVFEMVLPGLLNTKLVAALQSEGVEAVGLSGVDGKLLFGPRRSAVRVLEDGKRKIRRGDHSGMLREVNGALLETLLAAGYTPVVSPPMAGKDERDGREVVTPVNTDADRAAAAIAGELDATLVLLTDVPGILDDPADEATLIERVETPQDWERLETAAEGFMGRKVMAIEEALAGGAPRAIVADANADEPVLRALDGGGTHILSEALSATGDGNGDGDEHGAGNGDGDEHGDGTGESQDDTGGART